MRLLLALLVLAPGCLGTDRTFPDRSHEVVALHVNAYAEVGGPSPRRAIVEVSGLGADGEERAFRGRLRVVLEEQHYAEPEPSYTFVREWSFDVAPVDFASPTVPYHKVAIDAADLPRDATYRASAIATVLGREHSASALFAYSR